MLTTANLVDIYKLTKEVNEPQKQALIALLERAGINYKSLAEAVNHPSAPVVLETEGNRVGIALAPSVELVTEGEALVEEVKPKAPAKSTPTVVKKK